MKTKNVLLKILVRIFIYKDPDNTPNFLETISRIFLLFVIALAIFAEFLLEVTPIFSLDYYRIAIESSFMEIFWKVVFSFVNFLILPLLLIANYLEESRRKKVDEYFSKKENK